MNPRKWIKAFVYSAGTILLLAGLERLLVAAGTAPSLSLPEPLLGIPLRCAVLLVGGLELVVAFICLFGKRLHLQLSWLAWLTTDYAIYRLGVLMLGVHHQGTAIGSLTDPLCLAGGALGIMITFFPAYLLVGSCAGLAWLWLRRHPLDDHQPSTINHQLFTKMSCPACGVHIRFDSLRVGQQIACPQCKKTITLRRPENLKISCFFCHGHIEFPSHALGEKLRCPHCNMDITLKEPA